MTEIEFQGLVAAYVNRPVAHFTQGNPAVNLLRVAINNAKKWAQRSLDFELARTSVTVVVDAVTGGLLTSAVDTGSGLAVNVNRIENAYLGYVGSSQSVQAYRPIQITSKQHMAFRQRTAWENVSRDVTTQGYPTCTSINVPKLIRQGGTIFVSPVDASLTAVGTFTVLLDVYQWMPDYSDDIQDDFFLENCQDWLMYRSIRELSYFVKDANRAVVTGGMMDEAWKTVIDWNTSLSLDDDNTLA